MNTFGTLFKFTSFGESHGIAIGGVIDGFPANIEIDLEFIESELNKRKASTNTRVSTKRIEKDKVEILSGIFENRSLGTPIAFIIRNENCNSPDYENIKHLCRPSHGDDTYANKYNHRDYRGGGRASARETAARVCAGAFAKLLLKRHNIKINAYTEQIGNVKLSQNYKELNLNTTYLDPLRCPCAKTATLMEKEIDKCIETKDSIGGKVFCVIKNTPIGLGEPIFDKISAELAYAMMSIGASRSFEIGLGNEACKMLGSEHNDVWLNNGKTENNNCGGIRAGISTGEDIYFSVGFKPIASIGQEQMLLHQDSGLDNRLIKESIQGRHDVCCVPRAVSVVEAMAAICIADLLLLHFSTESLR